jgi:hypothetical protein
MRTVKGSKSGEISRTDCDLQNGIVFPDRAGNGESVTT